MKLKIFEAFSGIGAQNAALKNINKKINFPFEIIGTSDWDVFSSISYSSIHNIGFEKNKVSNEVINEFFRENTLSKDGKKSTSMDNLSNFDKRIIFNSFRASKNIGSIVDSYPKINKKIFEKGDKIDLLTYSFPCQDISSAGNFHGFNEGIKKHTRSGLLLEIDSLLVNIKKNNKPMPKYLILENVLNLVQVKHRKDFNIWLKKLNNLGYKNIWGVLDSSDFGLLQSRKRVFVISIYDPKNIVKNTRSLNEILINLKKEYRPKEQKTLKNVFDLENKYFLESDMSQMKNTPSRVKMILNGQHINNNVDKKISTVTTKQDRLPNLGYIDFENKKFDKNGVDYLNKRLVTPRECFSLMGFSTKDFERAQKLMNIINKSDVSSRDKLYKQAGNSIAINCLEMIFYLIYKIENGENYE